MVGGGRGGRCLRLVLFLQLHGGGTERAGTPPLPLRPEVSKTQTAHGCLHSCQFVAFTLIHNKWNREYPHYCISQTEYSRGDLLRRAAEMKADAGRRLSLSAVEYFMLSFFFFSQPICLIHPSLPPPPILSIIYFRLNGGWRIAPFAQWNMLKTLLARQLKGHVDFFLSSCMYFSFCPADCPHMRCGFVLTLCTSYLFTVYVTQLWVCCIKPSICAVLLKKARKKTSSVNGAEWHKFKDLMLYSARV